MKLVGVRVSRWLVIKKGGTFVKANPHRGLTPIYRIQNFIVSSNFYVLLEDL